LNRRRNITWQALKTGAAEIEGAGFQSLWVADQSEYVRIVEQLLAMQSSSFSGDYHSFDEAFISPPAFQKPRLPHRFRRLL
jgi:alkanesulfonate monooxygenase SsuD/methylene tetrahydromethanopterin reductase-like flavin-dependent oxidoreductase (luciferase family)